MDDEWRVGGYTEVRVLGEGAQGRVVLARHEASGTPVAIKYLSDRADEADLERLRHEARMLGQADSTHVARLFRLVEGPRSAAIIMEAVDGVSLKELLERHGALGPEASLTVLKGSLLGLAAAHAVGVVHRDYKPANVVVPADGRSRLVDFGIATPAGQEAGGAGTPYYMAPEQWGRHVPTPASDVYAATCVFVECVTGRRPYTGGRAELMRSHLTGPVPVDAVPEPLRPLVERGMAKAARDRPAGAAAFVDELERTAQAAYGPDWEDRGIRAMAAGAVALAALFPLAAWLLPGASGAASAGAASAGAASAGAGAGAAGAASGGAASGGAASAGAASAGAGSAGAGVAGAASGGAGSAGAASGGVASAGAGGASASGAGGTAAGKVGGTSALKTFLGSVPGKVVAAAGAAAVVAGAGTVVVGQVAERDEPAPGPSASVSATPVAMVADVQGCQVTGPGGEPFDESAEGPRRVTLPPQVELPRNAAVHSAGGRLMIGPAGASCAGSIGANSGTYTVGDTGMARITHNWQGSLGGSMLQLCQYFPDSPPAQRERAQTDDCRSRLVSRENVETGRPDIRAMLSADPVEEEHPPSPYVSARLATLHGEDMGRPITCTAPLANADICTAALTYWYVQSVEEAKLPKADLDRVAKRIAEFVPSVRR